jgi:hypothetical protein
LPHFPVAPVGAGEAQGTSLAPPAHHHFVLMLWTAARSTGAPPPSFLPWCVCTGVVNVAVDGEHGAASMLMDPPLPVFKYLADNYRIHGAPPGVLCKYNAEVGRLTQPASHPPPTPFAPPPPPLAPVTA